MFPIAMSVNGKWQIEVRKRKTFRAPQALQSIHQYYFFALIKVLWPNTSPFGLLSANVWDWLSLDERQILWNSYILHTKLFVGKELHVFMTNFAKKRIFTIWLSVGSQLNPPRDQTISSTFRESVLISLKRIKALTKISISYEQGRHLRNLGIMQANR